MYDDNDTQIQNVNRLQMHKHRHDDFVQIYDSACLRAEGIQNLTVLME